MYGMESLETIWSNTVLQQPKTLCHHNLNRPKFAINDNDNPLFVDKVHRHQRPLMLMIGNLPSRLGAFTSRLLLYQIPSEVCGV